MGENCARIWNLRYGVQRCSIMEDPYVKMLMSTICTHTFPQTLFTLVGALVVTLGLASLTPTIANLCAQAGLRACCLAPVQAKRSVVPFSSEKHNGFSTVFLSGLKVVLAA